MRYGTVIAGIFIRRINRFIACIEIDGIEENVHVKNTGRCENLLEFGVEVYLEVADNPNRKTKWDLIAVRSEKLGLVNIDSQMPNAVVREWLESNPFQLQEAEIKPEYKFGDSRVDFYINTGDRKILLEVKGCTLEKNGIGYFPDAPTKRGIKHLKELADAIKKGYESYLVYCSGIEGISIVKPNEQIDPKYAEAFYNAMSSGVQVICLNCSVTASEVTYKEANYLQF